MDVGTMIPPRASRPGLVGWRTLMAEVREFAPSVIHRQWLNAPVSTALLFGWAVADLTAPGEGCAWAGTC